MLVNAAGQLPYTLVRLWCSLHYSEVSKPSSETYYKDSPSWTVVIVYNVLYHHAAWPYPHNSSPQYTSAVQIYWGVDRIWSQSPMCVPCRGRTSSSGNRYGTGSSAAGLRYWRGRTSPDSPRTRPEQPSKPRCARTGISAVHLPRTRLSPC